MDPQRQRIQEDLRGLIAGDVRCDDVFLELYSTDASIYQIRPLGIVRPRSTEDVAACLRYCSQNQIPLHPRGAGSGLAGESLGAGLVLDCSTYLRSILSIDEGSARLQPGVIGNVKVCDSGWCRIFGEGFDGYIEQSSLWGVYPDEKL